MTWNGTGKARSPTSSVPPVVRGPVEGGVDQLLDAGPQPVDGPRREGGLDEAAQAGVVGRVEDEHRPAPGRVAQLAAAADERVPAWRWSPGRG